MYKQTKNMYKLFSFLLLFLCLTYDSQVLANPYCAEGDSSCDWIDDYLSGPSGGHTAVASYAGSTLTITLTDTDSNSPLTGGLGYACTIHVGSNDYTSTQLGSCQVLLPDVTPFDQTMSITVFVGKMVGSSPQQVSSIPANHELCFVSSTYPTTVSGVCSQCKFDHTSYDAAPGGFLQVNIPNCEILPDIYGVYSVLSSGESDGYQTFTYSFEWFHQNSLIATAETMRTCWIGTEPTILKFLMTPTSVCDDSIMTNNIREALFLDIDQASGIVHVTVEPEVSARLPSPLKYICSLPSRGGLEEAPKSPGDACAFYLPNFNVGGPVELSVSWLEDYGDDSQREFHPSSGAYYVCATGPDTVFLTTSASECPSITQDGLSVSATYENGILKVDVINEGTPLSDGVGLACTIRVGNNINWSTQLGSCQISLSDPPTFDPIDISVFLAVANGPSSVEIISRIPINNEICFFTSSVFAVGEGICSRCKFDHTSYEAAPGGFLQVNIPNCEVLPDIYGVYHVVSTEEPDIYQTFTYSFEWFYQNSVMATAETIRACWIGTEPTILKFVMTPTSVCDDSIMTNNIKEALLLDIDQASGIVHVTVKPEVSARLPSPLKYTCSLPSPGAFKAAPKRPGDACAFRLPTSDFGSPVELSVSWLEGYGRFFQREFYPSSGSYFVCSWRQNKVILTTTPENCEDIPVGPHELGSSYDSTTLSYTVTATDPSETLPNGYGYACTIHVGNAEYTSTELGKCEAPLQNAVPFDPTLSISVFIARLDGSSVIPVSDDVEHEICFISSTQITNAPGVCARCNIFSDGFVKSLPGGRVEIEQNDCENVSGYSMIVTIITRDQGDGIFQRYVIRSLSINDASIAENYNPYSICDFPSGVSYLMDSCSIYVMPSTVIQSLQLNIDGSGIVHVSVPYLPDLGSSLKYVCSLPSPGGFVMQPASEGDICAFSLPVSQHEIGYPAEVRLAWLEVMSQQEVSPTDGSYFVCLPEVGAPLIISNVQRPCWSITNVPEYQASASYDGHTLSVNIIGIDPSVIIPDHFGYACTIHVGGQDYPSTELGSCHAPIAEPILFDPTMSLTVIIATDFYSSVAKVSDTEAESNLCFLNPLFPSAVQGVCSQCNPLKYQLVFSPNGNIQQLNVESTTCSNIPEFSLSLIEEIVTDNPGYLLLSSKYELYHFDELVITGPQYFVCEHNSQQRLLIEDGDACDSRISTNNILDALEFEIDPVSGDASITVKPERAALLPDPYKFVCSVVALAGFQPKPTKPGAACTFRLPESNFGNPVELRVSWLEDYSAAWQNLFDTTIESYYVCSGGPNELILTQTPESCARPVVGQHQVSAQYADGIVSAQVVGLDSSETLPSGFGYACAIVIDGDSELPTAFESCSASLSNSEKFDASRTSISVFIASIDNDGVLSQKSNSAVDHPFCFAGAEHVILDQAVCSGCNPEDHHLVLSGGSATVVPGAPTCPSGLGYSLQADVSDDPSSSQYDPVQLAVGLHKDDGSLIVLSTQSVHACSIDLPGVKYYAMAHSSVCDSSIDPSALIDVLSISASSSVGDVYHVRIATDTTNALPSQLAYACDLAQPNYRQFAIATEAGDACTLTLLSTNIVVPLELRVSLQDVSISGSPSSLVQNADPYFICRSGDGQLMITHSLDTCAPPVAIASSVVDWTLDLSQYFAHVSLADEPYLEYPYVVTCWIDAGNNVNLSALAGGQCRAPQFVDRLGPFGQIMTVFVSIAKYGPNGFLRVSQNEVPFEACVITPNLIPTSSVEKCSLYNPFDIRLVRGSDNLLATSRSLPSASSALGLTLSTERNTLSTDGAFSAIAWRARTFVSNLSQYIDAPFINYCEIAGFGEYLASASSKCNSSLLPGALGNALTLDLDAVSKTVHVHLAPSAVSSLPIDLGYSCGLAVPGDGGHALLPVASGDLCTIALDSPLTLFRPLEIRVALSEISGPNAPRVQSASAGKYFICPIGQNEVILTATADECAILNLGSALVSVNLTSGNPGTRVAVAQVSLPGGAALPQGYAFGCLWQAADQPIGSDWAAYAQGSCRRSAVYSAAFDENQAVHIALFKTSGASPVQVASDSHLRRVCYVDDNHIALSAERDLCSSACTPALTGNNQLNYARSSSPNSIVSISLPVNCSIPASIFKELKIADESKLTGRVNASAQNGAFSGQLVSFNDALLLDVSASVSFNLVVNGESGEMMNAYKTDGCSLGNAQGIYGNSSLCRPDRCDFRTKLEFSVENGRIIARLPSNCVFPDHFVLEPQVPASSGGGVGARKRALTIQTAPILVPSNPYTPVSMTIVITGSSGQDSFPMSVCYLDDNSILKSASGDLCSAQCNPRSTLSAASLNATALRISLPLNCPALTRPVQCARGSGTPSSVSVVAIQDSSSLCDVAGLSPLTPVNITVSQNLRLNGTTKPVILSQPTSNICYYKSPLLNPLSIGAFCDAGCLPQNLLPLNSSVSLALNGTSARARLSKSNCVFPNGSNSFQYMANSSTNGALAPFSPSQDYVFQPSPAGVFGSASLNLWLANQTNGSQLYAESRGSVDVCVLDTLVRVSSAAVCKAAAPQEIAKYIQVKQTAVDQLVVFYNNTNNTNLSLADLKLPNYTHFCQIDLIFNIFYTATHANYANNTLCVVNTRWDWPLVPFSWLQLDIEMRRDNSSFRAPDADISICYVDANHIYLVPNPDWCLLTSHPKIVQPLTQLSVKKNPSNNTEFIVSGRLSKTIIDVLHGALEYTCNGNKFVAVAGTNDYSCLIGKGKKGATIAYSLKVVDRKTGQVVLQQNDTVKISSSGNSVSF